MSKQASVVVETDEALATSTEPHPSMAARIVSGSIGSVLTATAVTPLEVVKVRLQSGESPPSVKVPLPSNVSLCRRGCGTFVLNNGLYDCILPKSAVPYFCQSTGRLLPSLYETVSPPAKTTTSTQLGTFATLRRIFLTEGIQGIYAGFSATLVMSVPQVVLYYVVYDELCNRIASSTTSIPAQFIPLVSGASARLLASFATAPLELIRTRQASYVGNNSQVVVPGIWQEVKTIVKEGGVGGLYKGLAPTLWRDVPFSAIYWFTLERMRHSFRYYTSGNHSERRWLSPFESFVCGAGAGMFAAFCTTPFDVVKTRMQMVAETSALEAAAAEAAAVATKIPAVCNHDGLVAYRMLPLQQSTLSIMTEIWKEEGIAGLWRGNQARMIKVAPACAIMIASYDYGKRLLSS